MGQDQTFRDSHPGVCPNCGTSIGSAANFCPSCGTPVEAAPGSAGLYNEVPVRLSITYEFGGPLSADQLVLNRVLLFIKWLFAIPLYVAAVFYSIAAFIVIFISFWAILFTGRYPRDLFDFVLGFLEFLYRVFAYFPLLLTNHWTPNFEHPLRVEADYPESCSRLVLVFLKLPSFLLGVVSNLAAFVLFLLFLLAIPAWLYILVTGRYPAHWFAVSTGMLQWSCRVTAWQDLMRDDFSLFGTTTPVRVIVVIGLVLSLVVGFGNCSVSF